ncbi:MAG: glutamyl-tRNA reductase [Polyangiaceae bacterium]|nr:glutamyl-tRNA reductase [Polyangiaceae bacterium]
MIFVFGLSYKTAPVEVRERLAQLENERLFALFREREDIREAVFLSTCNRVELYLDGPDDEHSTFYHRLFEDLLSLVQSDPDPELRNHFYEKSGVDAVRHIFRVASSLESMVVGEPQILGQVKEAYEAASATGMLRGNLRRCVERAISSAKRVRTETSLGEGLVSVSSVAVDVAKSVFGDLKGKTVLLLGAGEMGEAAARSLGKNAKAIRICNRNEERGQKLAREVGGTYAPWSALEAELTIADVVVASTGSTTYIVTEGMVRRIARARRGKTLVLVDISVPRNIEPSVNDIDNVYLFDIDDLEKQVAAGLAGRSAEVTKAAKILETEIIEYETWSKSRGAKPVIVALRAKVRATFLSELERMFASRLKHLSEGDRAVLEQMLESAINKHLHPAIQTLKSDPTGSDLSVAVRRVFDLPDLELPPDSTDSIPPEARPDEAARKIH